MNDEAKRKGIILAMIAATLWGISGAFADVVFVQFHAPVEWVVGTRLLLAGFLILLYARFVLRLNLFLIFRSSRDIFSLLIFGLIGMIACQYLFFSSIGVNGAGLATILQFNAPIFIYLYLVFKKEKKIHAQEIAYIILTFIGVFLVVTGGHFNQLDFNLSGLVLGIGSAMGVAFYTLQPRHILKKYGAPIVVGWGMFFGGIAFQFVHPIWNPGFEINGKFIFYMGFITVVGTAIAFSCYSQSLNYMEASLTNIISAIEPLLANVLTHLLLGQSWTVIQILGIAVVLIFVVLFVNYSEKPKEIVN